MNQLKKISRDQVLLLIIGFVCLLGFLILLILFFFRASTSQLQEVPRQGIEPNHSSESTLKYQSGTQGKLYDELTSERTLIADDESKRALIISGIGNKSGTLYASSNALLGYLSSPDYFQAEITTTDVDSAKKEVVDWFLSKGVSKSGICDLQIMFMLDEKASSYFIEQKLEFNPLAPGC